MIKLSGRVTRRLNLAGYAWEADGMEWSIRRRLRVEELSNPCARNSRGRGSRMTMDNEVDKESVQE